MNPELQRRFDVIERRKQAIFDGLAGRDDAWLNRAPEPGAWSIVQVVGHLVLAESGTLDYIAKKIQAPPEKIPGAGISSALRSWALGAALASPLRRKAPERSRPGGEPESLESVRGRWDAVRDRWRERLESYPDALMRKAIFRHPFAGRLSMPQTLRFVDDHLRHHVRQIDRFKRLLG